MADQGTSERRGNFFAISLLSRRVRSVVGAMSLRYRRARMSSSRSPLSLYTTSLRHRRVVAPLSARHSLLRLPVYACVSGLQKLESHIRRENEDSIFDVPFTFEEVSTAVRKAKRGKSPGPDDIMAEHLLEGGEAVVKWLVGIFNAIVCNFPTH